MRKGLSDLSRRCGAAATHDSNLGDTLRLGGRERWVTTSCPLSPRPAPAATSARLFATGLSPRAAAASGMPSPGTPCSDIGDRMIRLTLRLIAVIVLAGTWSAPAVANPLGRGPVAVFLTLFQQPPVPRQVV